ncbi:MAG TPA: VOC family protein [Pyrinomonadaceae bacterium]|jgi:catechol 2,3-dioxygenase-like lactoylglutathione lyase family enzyme
MSSNYKKNIGIEIQTKNGFPVGWLIIGLIAIFAFFSTIAHGQTGVQKIESVGFTVSDMDKAIDFYTRVLSFEKISDTETWGEDYERLSGVFGSRVRIVDLRLGNEMLELTEYLTPQGRPIPVDSRSNDQWFQHIAIIVSDMDKAFEVLRKNKVRFASTAPQTLPKTIPNAAGISAFYFKDFDNHVLEILHFPPDKGLQKWHDLAKTGKLFLGIDHTAIVVGKTDESLKFYRDALGLTVAGNSDNFGVEQEHLNNVQGAKLHITGLRTARDGIAVEFLKYVAPQNGRAFPKDTRSSDLWHWQTTFTAPKTDVLAAFLVQKKYDFISNGVVLFKENTLGFQKGFLVRDIDGHAVRIIEN